MAPGHVVSLTGGGGKTSLLLALAREARSYWGPRRLLVTTTTRMFVPTCSDFPPLHASAGERLPRVELLLCNTRQQALNAVEHWAKQPEHEETLPVLAHHIVPSPGDRPKLVGIPPQWIDELARSLPGLATVVEADGSAQRPLKAPAGHEPVIPSSTTIVLAVAGMDAMGRPLGPRHVHRPERVSALTGSAPGQIITPRDMAHVLWHPEGCARGRPVGSRVWPVVNGVDSPDQLAAARWVARELLDLGAPFVLLTSCLDYPVVVEVCS